MATPPRIALLVHSRFEDDPRVSRHARAIREAGLRAAVLSVGVTPGPEGWRWGAPVDDTKVYESTARLTWLGRLRRFLGAFPRLRAREETPAFRPLSIWLRGGLKPAARLVDEPPRPSGRGFKTIHSSGLRPASAAEVSRPAAQAEGMPSSGGMGGVGRDLWRFAQLLRGNLAVARQFRPIGARLVHANDLNVLPAGLLLAWAWKAPLLYDSHELWTALDADWSPFFRRLLGGLERWLIRRASAVVTVNGAIADELATRYGIPRPVVVMNCPEAPTSAAEPDFSLDGSLPVIYQGMLNPHRGLLELVDAVATTPEATLALRGPGVLRAPLQERIDQLGVGERIQLLPPVPMNELVSALDGFAVGVVPYLPVGKNNELCSPNKLFEYMGAGLAVVCSDLPVLREVVSQANCGVLVPPGDSAAMAAALRTLAAEPETLAAYRRHAWQAARERYNAAHEERKLVALYRGLIGGTGPEGSGKDRA